MLENGKESESYIDAVKFVHLDIINSEINNIPINNIIKSCALMIHNKIRYSYNEDFNGPLLSWYRKFIKIYGENK